VHDETRSQSAKSKEPEANEVGALERALERFVLDLDLDWDAFHYLLLESLKDVDCRAGLKNLNRTISGVSA
jgi:hypothetical protein